MIMSLQYPIDIHYDRNHFCAINNSNYFKIFMNRYLVLIYNFTTETELLDLFCLLPIYNTKICSKLNRQHQNLIFFSLFLVHVIIISLVTPLNCYYILLVTCKVICVYLRPTYGLISL